MKRVSVDVHDGARDLGWITRSGQLNRDRVPHCADCLKLRPDDGGDFIRIQYGTNDFDLVCSWECCMALAAGCVLIGEDELPSRFKVSEA